MKDSVIFRNMRGSDFQSLYALWKQVGLSVAPVNREQHEFSMMLALNSDTCLAACHNKQIVGSILGLFNGRRAWIYHLVVEPDWQKRGLGARLLDVAEEKLKKKGATRVLLWVDTSNSSVAPFYEKQGYRRDDGYVLFGKDLIKKYKKFKKRKNI